MTRRYNYQKQEVIDAMQGNGGFATLGQLYSLLDFSAWTTQTPEASVRRIVQNNQEFFKIREGLWALTSKRESVLEKFQEGSDTNVSEKDASKQTPAFTHTFYQGLIVEIGNLKHFKTSVANGDRNRIYCANRPLKEIVSLDHVYSFTYPDHVRMAATIDVVWFNERRFPAAFYEVEHTTNIEHSLVKFCEFQDFRVDFFIIAKEERRKQFDASLGKSVFKDIQGRVFFHNYEDLIKQHAHESELAKMKTI